MDDTDIATEREELARAAAISQRKPTGPAAMGFCHFCETPIAVGHRWCNVDCRNDWQAEHPDGR